MRLEARAPQGLQLQVYDGEHGWIRGPDGAVRDVPDNVLKDMATSVKRDTVAALLAADRGELHPRLLPDVKDEDGSLRHVLELSSPALEPLVLYVDPRTYLIVRESYVVGFPGRPMIEELFSDYRVVDGVNMPHTVEVRTADRPLVTRHLSLIDQRPRSIHSRSHAPVLTS